MKEFPIKGWKWTIYIFGWITGILNLLFWGYQYYTYLKDKSGEFFSDKFHKRVYYWGVFYIYFTVITCAVWIIIKQ